MQDIQVATGLLTAISILFATLSFLLKSGPELKEDERGDAVLIMVKGHRLFTAIFVGMAFLSAIAYFWGIALPYKSPVDNPEDFLQFSIVGIILSFQAMLLLLIREC